MPTGLSPVAITQRRMLPKLSVTWSMVCRSEYGIPFQPYPFSGGLAVQNVSETPLFTLVNSLFIKSAMECEGVGHAFSHGEGIQSVP